ncbi:MAG: peptidase family protein [Peptococcaceae bacterium]|jgi:hypothetical protein|uniref:DUF4911 domain-containing protein n=1 Tax=Thermanaerosceptrum fracticalcis TaxID=1712410 RepID=A0A7G6DZR9_THEFR|nr:DUF4911 domain-containing protein [Thermanaerosceptrum fracticalcis]MBZ4652834.1 peptidase family protein [Peptococcaceae bacterium]QNB45323.1 DUF4911 domain-containing protein [Thermanaerosceptrum fracticalcis]
MRNRICLKIPKKEITYLTKIMEGYDNLGVVSTIDPKEGLVMIHITPDTRDTVREILHHLPFVTDINED